jgi:uncharacterized protein
MLNVILDILRKNGIAHYQIKFINSSEGLEQIEVEITDEEANKSKWDYFACRICTEESGIKSLQSRENIREGFVRYIFRIPFRSINVFLDGINRRYHTVAPKVDAFSVLIKPTHKCNMNCVYCYELPYRKRYKDIVMDMETLDKIFSMLSQYAKKVQVIWHGGEPTEAGKKWYIRAYNQVISKYPMIDLETHLMTNGINLMKDEEWLDLFGYYNIQFGISYNAFYQKILRPSQHLYDLEELKEKAMKKGKKFGVIDVISNENYKHLKDIYEYYKKIKISPCFNQIFYTEAAAASGQLPDIEDFTRAYIDYIFYWIKDKQGIYERAAAEVLEMVLNGQGITCRHGKCHYGWLCFCANGDIYPCDHYYPDEYKIGHISQYNSIEEIFHGSAYNNFVKEIEERFRKYCSKCYAFNGCHGGCHGSIALSAGKISEVDRNYCYFTREVYKAVYNEVRNIIFYKEEDQLNPHVYEIMKKSGYYSIKEIKELLGSDLHLHHNLDDLNESDEFKLFMQMNHPNKRTKGIHQNIVLKNPKEKMDGVKNEIIDSINIEKRKRSLLDFCWEVISDVLPVSRKAC